MQVVNLVEGVRIVGISVSCPAVLLGVPAGSIAVTWVYNIGRACAAPVHTVDTLVRGLLVPVVYFVGIIGIKGQVFRDMSLHVTVEAQLVVRDLEAVAVLLEGYETKVILIAVGVLIDT